jgi:hypothetical protein
MATVVCASQLSVAPEVSDRVAGARLVCLTELVRASEILAIVRRATGPNSSFKACGPINADTEQGLTLLPIAVEHAAIAEDARIGSLMRGADSPAASARQRKGRGWQSKQQGHRGTSENEERIRGEI